MKSKYGSNLAWIDMLYSMVAICSFLFIVAYAMINPDVKKKTVDLKAEYVVTMTWPDKSADDIDLHLLMPDGGHVFFQNKDVKYITLDRDDRGMFNDVYTDGDGVAQMIYLNKEIITIRAVVPGHYVVNVHVYEPKDGAWGFKAEDRLPYNARVTLIKLNPSAVDVITKDVMLERSGQQVTAFSFDIEKDGSISNVVTDVSIPFIEVVPSAPNFER